MYKCIGGSYPGLQLMQVELLVVREMLMIGTVTLRMYVPSIKNMFKYIGTLNDFIKHLVSESSLASEIMFYRFIDSKLF